MSAVVAASRMGDGGRGGGAEDGFAGCESCGGW